MVNCPYCGKLTDPKLDGCPHCGGFLKKKLSAVEAAKETSQSCPSCSAVVQRGDIICVVCGTNLLTGQKVADAPTAASSSGSGNSLKIVGGLVAAAIVVVLVGLVIVNSGDPVEKAKALIADYRYPEASELLKAYVEENPDDDEAWFELGKLQVRATQYGDAAVSFRNVVDINPTHEDAALMAVVSLHRGTDSSAVNQQIAILDRVAQNAQDNAQIWYLLAMALSVRGEEGDIERQIEALEHVVGINANFASAKLDLGISHILDGDTLEARRHLSGVNSETFGGNATASLAFLDASDARAESAAKKFIEALQADRLSVRWQAHTALAQILISQGRFREAEQGLQSALGVNPNNDLGRYLRGIALHALNRANEALEEYETVARAQGPYAGLAAVQSANIQLALGNSSAADRSISIARRAGIESPSFYTVNGRVQGSLGNVLDAMDSFNKALAMDPTYAPAYLERGLVNVRQDRTADGVRDLNNYLQLIGTDTVGTKANEIRILTGQLQRTLNEG
jgi:tetratricopeptide (TPR) repeat protein